MVACVTLPACASNPTAATPPTLPDSYAKCSVRNSQSRPLIVEWASSDRAALESLAKRGVVAVRYSGCEMEVLSQCRVKREYSYTPVTLQSDRITISDSDELYARVPIGAAKLEGELERSGQLNVDTAIVGTWDSGVGGVSRTELEGSCDRATHVLTSLTVGAFRFYSGAAAATGGGAGLLGFGAGGTTRSEQILLSLSGDGEACKQSSRDDQRPPEGCSALLRVEATPIAGSGTPPPSAQTEQPDVAPEAPGDSGGGMATLPPDSPAPTPGQATGSDADTPLFDDGRGPRDYDAGKVSLGPGFVLGLRGPFAVHFGDVEEGVALHDYALVTVGLTLELGARLSSLITLVGTASAFAGKSSRSTGTCNTEIECRATILGVGGDLVVTPLGTPVLWLGVGAEYAYLALRRESTGVAATTVETARNYHALSPRLSIGVDVMDKFVPWIQYGFMLSYMLRKGVSASGTNEVGGVEQPFGGDGDGVSHTLMIGGRFHLDFGTLL